MGVLTCVRDCVHPLLFLTTVPNLLFVYVTDFLLLWRVTRFGGGFTEWRQPFRLRHVVTGRFLGVRPVCRANCGGGGGGGKEGTGEEGRGENNRDPQTGAADDRYITVLLEPSEATFKTSAFYFTDATVRYIIFSKLVTVFVYPQNRSGDICFFVVLQNR